MNENTASTVSSPVFLNKTIVLVGLMGSGKSTVGRRLAARLDVPFVDADSEIESAAGCSVEDIFRLHGEAAFRDGERRVIRRLLAGPVCVLATGGGAFIDPETSAAVKRQAISVWLQADLDILVERCARRGNRPLLARGDPRGILGRLLEERRPHYAKADIVVQSGTGPHEEVVDKIVDRLHERTGAEISGETTN